MMLKYSLDLEDAADAIENAIAKVLDEGILTGDLAGKDKKSVSTKEMGDEIAKRI
jgi:3-isopropylmalate dehydrogenase